MRWPRKPPRRSPTIKKVLASAAAFLVVVRNYFLFVSGSVFILKGLKKSDPYYYDEKHMPVVSGLPYRMEQNTVRLASIAILSTCVLIILGQSLNLWDLGFSTYLFLLESMIFRKKYSSSG